MFPPDLLTPPIERATAPAAKTAPEEETAHEEETAPGEQIGLEEDTAVEEKQKIPEIERPCLDSFKWGSHNRSKVGSRKFLSFIRGRIPVSQSFTVNNRQDFKNRMMRSTPVVLRQARGKLPGLVVPSATNDTFRRITEGIPYNRHVNVCFSAVQEVEDSMTLDSFLDEHEHPFRQPDIHPMNIIDLDIGPHKKTMKHKFSIPNLIEEYSLGHIYTSRLHHSIRDEFDFTAGISDYLLMSEEEAETDWHQDFTGTSAFYILLNGRKEFFLVEPTEKAQERFDEWRESTWKRFVKMKFQLLLFSLY